MLRFLCGCCDPIGDGVMNPKPWPTTPRWTGRDKALLMADKHEPSHPTPDLTPIEIIRNSAKFPIPFPVETVRCAHLKEKVSSDTLHKNINSAYPLMHESALYLCSLFLNHQKTGRDSNFYKNMTLFQFVDRLLSKRAVVFVGDTDHYLLLDGTRGEGCWEGIGRDRRSALSLDNCLSYDEIKLAALLSVSSHTCFINDGRRSNRGVADADWSRIEKGGVIMGLIGARLEKENVMEYREVVKSGRQNTHELGYGQFKALTLQGQFLRFYGDSTATYQELVRGHEFSKFPERYVSLGSDTYFDKLMFERRISLSIDTLLVEANDRGRREQRRAYVYVVGLGLGVWKIHQGQDKIFMDTFARRLELLGPSLPSVSDVHFAYIQHNMAARYKHGDLIHGIAVHISNRNPHEKLTGPHQGKLLVVSYAWDGNAFPGNEFWIGNLAASGDPAAACSTQIAELHNCYINTRVCARNLRVATLNQGLVTFQQYQMLHRND